MRFLVVFNGEVIAEKRCMDDALDVVRDMENFDKDEGFYKPRQYVIRAKRERGDKK